MIGLVVLWVMYFAIHSLLADLKVKAWFENNWPTLFPFYRLCYNVIATLGFAGIWLYQRSLSPNRLIEPNYILAMLGWVLMGGGIVIGLIALGNYNLGEFSGFAYTKNVKAESLGGLQTGGLNAIVRHPLYLAIFLFFVGSLLSNMTDISLLLFIVFTAYLLIGIHYEEKKLVVLFGEEYIAYQNKVKRLIPFLL
ncbi:MAG: isoprenylcysteine carboxylmethyltransferase family protein [Bacteroidota bacterium]